MAGLGRKEFNSGDILLASEVQGYLQDQAVMVFDDDTARGSAIPTPSEGMLTYNKDTEALELYDGSAFGPVGSDAGLIHINTTAFSGVSSVSVNDVFTSTYSNYRIFLGGSLSASGTGGTINLRMRASGTDATGSDYNVLGVSTPAIGYNVTNQTSAIVGYAAFNTANSNWGSLILDLVKPFSAEWTHFYSESQGVNGSSQDAWLSVGGNHRVTTSYDGFTLIFPANNTGSVRVYGYKN